MRFYLALFITQKSYKCRTQSSSPKCNNKGLAGADGKNENLVTHPQAAPHPPTAHRQVRPQLSPFQVKDPSTPITHPPSLRNVPLGRTDVSLLSQGLKPYLPRVHM